jgi:carboxyl-terminal processing protease
MRSPRKLAVGLGCLLVAGGGTTAFVELASKTSPHALHAAAPLLHPSETKEIAAEGDEDGVLEFRPPSTRPASLTCADAQRIVKDFREDQLAYEAPPPATKAFTDAVADWLDPVGVWSASADSPVVAEIERAAPLLIAELQGSGACTAPTPIAAALVKWVASLRKAYDAAKGSPAKGDLAALAATPLADTAAPSLDVVRGLGARHAALATPELTPWVDRAEAQLLPSFTEAEWSEVLLAAAVRAYVDTTDPHSEWAPYGEESSVYDVDLEAQRPAQLWERATRTLVGAKIESGALAPLEVGDVVLEVNSSSLGGLSVEQMDQASYGIDADSPANVVVLRGGKVKRLTVKVTDRRTTAVAAAPFDLPVDRIAFGTGEVAIIAIHDVYDDLGTLVQRAVAREREQKGAALVGIVLDLRGDGGGSTEGAIDTLGLFLPGAKLFPMKRRDGTIETDRAPEPGDTVRWSGPLATLVDVGTASAAEMIAGALASYRRAPIVGTGTYGKGCAQEYMEDVVHAGVLRVTTLLYALPDGSAVQRVGLAPTYQFPFEPEEKIDRESSQANAPPSWTGPDVRSVAPPAPPWPAHQGIVGPCRDRAVCRAIDLLGDEKKRVASARGK